MKKNPLQIGLAGLMVTATVLCTPASAAQFTDVPSNHWASTTISNMADKGILKGVSENQFAPDQSVTNPEFITMMVRQLLGEPPRRNQPGNPWYLPYTQAAYSAGYFYDLPPRDYENAITRYDMAFLLRNANLLIPTPNDAVKPPDWAKVPEVYQDAVLFCYGNQLLRGIDEKGTFGGDTTMNRAQAATVLARLMDLPQPQLGIPAGATIFKDVKKDPLIHESEYPWNMINLGYGAFKCFANGTGDSSSGMRLALYKDFSTLHLTYQANSYDQEISVSVPAEYNGGLESHWIEKGILVKKGETRTVSITVRFQLVIDLTVGAGTGADGILSNVYLTK